MFWADFKMAINTLRVSKTRTFLTMLGIIVGVASVVSIFSVSQGLENKVAENVDRVGRDTIIVTPGDSVTRDENGQLESYDPIAQLGAAGLTESDLNIVKKTDNISEAVPVSVSHGELEVGDNSMEDGVIVATNGGYEKIRGLELKRGGFIGGEIENEYSAVIGSEIAEEWLGNADAALGRKIDIKGTSFSVVGILEEYEANFSPSLVNFDRNNAVYISFSAAKKFNDGHASIAEIVAKVKNLDIIDKTVSDIDSSISQNHNNVEDFSVIKYEETVTAANSVLGLITTFVASVALISLVMGGVGVMNIMLVEVTERINEIGLRKSIGATKWQITRQFLIEAVVISTLGGMIGVALSLIINWLISSTTQLEPVMKPHVVIGAIAASMLVGLIFGGLPAHNAARKKPIDSLRHQ